MDELLGQVICGCGACCCSVLTNTSPECLQKVVCCPLILCDQGCNNHCEAGLRCWCKCCCGFLRMWALSCSSSNSSYYYIDCRGSGCGVSAATLCGFIVAAFCILLGIVCEITAYDYGNNQCNTPIDAHVVVQGVVLIGDGIVLLYVLGKYYIRKSIDFPLPHATVFPRFHGLFVKDLRLAFLLGTVSLGFWWAILGYYWLAGVECEPQDDFLLTVDSFAIAVEFILVLFFLVLVYIVLVIAACDEGSCRFGSAGMDCFLCCCRCCLKTPSDFDQRYGEQVVNARNAYPPQRNSCLQILMDIIKLCGCIRPGYTRRSLNEVEVALPEELEQPIQNASIDQPLSPAPSYPQPAVPSYPPDPTLHSALSYSPDQAAPSYPPDQAALSYPPDQAALSYPPDQALPSAPSYSPDPAVPSDSPDPSYPPAPVAAQAIHLNFPSSTTEAPPPT